MITLESILKRSASKDIGKQVDKYFEAINKWVFDEDEKSRVSMKKTLEKLPRIPWDSRTYNDRLNKLAADTIKKGHELLVSSFSQPFFTIVTYQNGKFYKYYPISKKREWVMDGSQQERGGSNTPNIDTPDCYILPEGTLKMLNELN